MSVRERCLLFLGICALTGCSESSGITASVKRSPTLTPVESVKLSEHGGAQNYELRFMEVPSSDVIVSVRSEPVGVVGISATPWLISPSNALVSRMIGVYCMDNDEPGGDRTALVTFDFSSEDLAFDGVFMTREVTCVDDDVREPDPEPDPEPEPEPEPEPDPEPDPEPEPEPEPVYIMVTPGELSVEEGQSAAFTVSLSRAPSRDVYLLVTSSDTSELLLDSELLTWSPQNWSEPKRVTVSGARDNIADGDQNVRVSFRVTSADLDYDDLEVPDISVVVRDIDATVSTDSVHVRVMAANLTTGNYSSYYLGHGKRIFQAVQPDIVLIQEFNYENYRTDTEDDRRAFVDDTFGEEFQYYRSDYSKPNGIISRYPIVSGGTWASSVYTDRGWDWAVIDLPGARDLLAISVHLHTDKNAKEMEPLMAQIQAKIDEDMANYYVLIGGDFNTTSRAPVVERMSSIFVTSSPYPVDQNGNANTNEKRAFPYDWLLCSPDLCAFETPVAIGNHTGDSAYAHGHVFDSRVYFSAGELEAVAPVERYDSDKRNSAQHMGVIRDFTIKY